jgi:electron transfer flavoprotein alpha subunit
MASSIFIIAEHFDGKLRPVTYELASFALKLAQFLQSTVSFLILGDDTEIMAKEIAENTGLDVLAFSFPALKSYNQEIYISQLSNWLKENPFSYVLTAHTTQGMDFAPGLSIGTDAGCITGVEDFSVKDHQLSFQRSLFNGKISSQISPISERMVLTVLPGMHKPMEFKPNTPGKVEARSVDFSPEHIRNKGVVRSRTGNQALGDAEIIISAGRGIGKQENLPLIYHLAERFSKSAVGGSRPLCDLGWLGYQQQVGVTGMSVSPRLYFACGISGAIQHLSGIRGADFIVAVNTDPTAAIFNMADVCIVEDLLSFIPVLIETLDEATR